MNELLYSPKITPEHLARKAMTILPRIQRGSQNTESQRLQYDMAERILSRVSVGKKSKSSTAISAAVQPLARFAGKDLSVSSSAIVHQGEVWESL